MVSISLPFGRILTKAILNTLPFHGVAGMLDDCCRLYLLHFSHIVSRRDAITRKFHRDEINAPSRWSKHSIAMKFLSYTFVLANELRQVVLGIRRKQADPYKNQDKVLGSRFKVQSSRFKVQGFLFLVSGFWFQERPERATSP